MFHVVSLLHTGRDIYKEHSLQVSLVIEEPTYKQNNYYYRYCYYYYCYYYYYY